MKPCAPEKLVKSEFQKKCLCLGVTLIFSTIIIGCAGMKTYPFNRADKVLATRMVVGAVADLKDMQRLARKKERNQTG